MSMKAHSSACERNRDVILDVLKELLPSPAHVLEIASGSGQHAVHFAANLPHLTWQPTDVDATALQSIAAWADEAGLQNLLPPRRLDVLDEDWKILRADALVCANMIHISPWESCVSLFSGATKLLPPQGPLLLYGPFVIDAIPTAPSNLEFDAYLRARDARWGIRDLSKVAHVAERAGLALERYVAMPANNFSVIFRKKA